MSRQYFIGAAMSFGIAALFAGGVASPASAASFPAAVERILMSQNDGPIAKLPAAKKRALISCVNQVLAELPKGKKRFVIEAGSYADMESRFGKIVSENHAEWKQRIARDCAHLAV